MAEANAKPLRLLLGFDYGSKQIGVAVGQVITGQARELCILKAQNGVPDWQKVEALIKEWQPDAIVVGLPLNMDGTKSEMSDRAEKFARRLNGRFNLPVHTHDERLTTYEAKGQRLQQGQNSGYRERPVDALAAALLLQGWLEENCLG
ncbi:MULTISPECIES: Holliday junction resolvase RuvX [Pseudomonas]|jgi:putative Holliday junction resolvase|uniref:Holliday junction resolvase RuvX n=1 Tax=Pseudomonas TaxID=286 RepID=UPI0008CD7AE8|nr:MULTISPECIES: Holliday junction resolvase RuvX [Pseudomonas]OHC28913.1 MAG: Holliday junction DNA helicase RuvA [Pseudomonadales bacterium RIFCSPHIGHO2_02_FULL_60_43]PKM25175.1 MAG: Holliday junction resolvase RuvX [Gammaproteobacteria bacterium HGW-Gammaproteobacteria-13]MDO9619618.1 Holliday junction resolvase RuvX [Pseudomonas sp.]MDP2444425.1 Holliday junction resolvase RuvX [Pseudomonas sp.]MDR7023780.1 putative Holliday junction resolvase [Pseudomonas peli]